MRTSSMILAAAGTASAFSGAGNGLSIARIGRHTGSSMSLRSTRETPVGSLSPKGKVAAASSRDMLAEAASTLGAAAMAASLLLSPITATAEVSGPSPMYLMAEAAEELPPNWESAVAEGGQTFYYNSKTGVSQWESPAKPVADGKKAKSRRSGGSSQNLNEMVMFKAPVVPVDRITVKEKVAPQGQCGESDFRSNSLECGEPALNPVADAVIKGVGTMESIMSEDNVKTLQQKALRADERARMLQEAEMKALAKTDLFKKLDAQTKDPTRIASRKKQVEDITNANDLGSRQAPWSRPEDPAETGELPKLKEAFKLPELKIPEFKLPF